jgi:biotin transporter BioY
MRLSDEGFLILFLFAAMLCGWLLHKIVNRETNNLQWEDLVATHGILNAYKIGYWVGVILGGFINVWIVYVAAKPDSGYFMAYLAFLGGVPVVSGAIGRPPLPPPPHPPDVERRP